jgi:hypothetical protein
MATTSILLHLTPGFKLIQTQPGKSFRVNARGLFLTYSTQLDKQAFRDFILSKPTCRDAQVWIVHESTMNTHILLDFGAYRFETRNEEFFDFGPTSSRPMIMTIDGRHHNAWQRALFYLLQHDPTNPELLAQLQVTPTGIPPPKKIEAFDPFQVFQLLQQLAQLGIKIEA